ncbi:MAG TPA: RagB/SusD family nutrient uptake outer membrane protein [Flavobacteriaceae bacterium]|jgi:hypothetical protein|nr:RagB/SusD family nutrient uptake outer membrane protein [Flavobacteriaceae bacterium]
MKNLKTLILSLALVLFITNACNESFTEVPAYGALSDESLANATGIDLLLTGTYSVLDGQTNTQGGWTSSGDNWWIDVISDDAHKGSTDGDQADLYEIEVFNWSTGNGYWLGLWKAPFSGVNRANSVINLISSADEDYPVLMAQARFLRAHFNMQLLLKFGNVPNITPERAAALEYNLPNSGETQLTWADIEADLQFAVANLPSSYSGSYSEPGRPLSHGAKAYLGKAYLYQSKWADASSSLDAVIGSGAYSLNPEYVENFKSSGENSSESVFAIQFAADGGVSNQGNKGGTLNFPAGGPIGSCCGFYQPSQDLVDAFQTDANGLPLLDTYQNTHVANDYHVASADPFTLHTGNLDPRLDYTAGRRGIDYNGWGPAAGKDWIRASFDDISGPYLSKKNMYYAGDDANRGTGGWGEQRSGINYHFMRYSDVLLMAAEAAVETGNTSKALGYVNQVRNRAKGSTPPDSQPTYVIEPYTSFTSADYARKAVRFERRLELGMEGHRLFDLRRWGNAGSVMTTYFAKESEVVTSFARGQSYQGKHDLFPIPIVAIDQSQGVITQNSGY